MNTKTAFAMFLLSTGALFCAQTARAEVFIGAGVSSNSYDYSDLSESSGSKIFGGYYADNGVFGEFAAVDLGETKSDSVPLGFKVSGSAFYIGYRAKVGTGLEGFGKVGLYSTDTDLIASGSTVATESGSGLTWGLGLAYAFTKTVAIRGEIEDFVAVKDFADDRSITGGSISLEFRF